MIHTKHFQRLVLLLFVTANCIFYCISMNFSFIKTLGISSFSLLFTVAFILAFTHLTNRAKRKKKKFRI